METFTEYKYVITIDLIVLAEVGSLTPLLRNTFLKYEDLTKVLNVKPSLAIILYIIFRWIFLLRKIINFYCFLWFYIFAAIGNLSLGWSSWHITQIFSWCWWLDLKYIRSLLFKWVTNPIFERWLIFKVAEHNKQLALSLVSPFTK